MLLPGDIKNLLIVITYKYGQVMVGKILKNKLDTKVKEFFIE